MSDTVILTEHLAMTYKTPVRGDTIASAVRSLFHRTYDYIPAVKDFNITVEAGELVGFVGPNGAGKSTFVKMLAGVIKPTEGKASILGHIPFRREYSFLKSIAMVRGSKPLSSSADLTTADIFRFQQRMYDVSDSEYRKNMGLLDELLGLKGISNRQIRTLSLGEKMRAGFANSLLYGPRVIFFDEPTIGVDVAYIEKIRTFISDYVKATGATVLLTSHNMTDISKLCHRVVLINSGMKQYDGELSELVHSIDPTRIITIETNDPLPVFPDALQAVVMESDIHTAKLRVASDDANQVLRTLLELAPGCAISVAAPELDTVMVKAYKETGL